MIERLPISRGIGANEDADDSGQLRDAADLPCCPLYLLLRDDRSSEETAFALGDVIDQPVVVRLTLYLGELCVTRPLNAQKYRGIEHRLCDAVLGHVVEARLRVVGRGANLGVSEFALPRPLEHVRISGGTGRGKKVRNRSLAVVDAVLGTVRRCLDVPDAVAVLLWRIVLHGRRMFQHVTISVYEREFGLAHRSFPLISRVCRDGRARGAGCAIPRWAPVILSAAWPEPSNRRACVVASLRAHVPFTRRDVTLPRAAPPRQGQK